MKRDVTVVCGLCERPTWLSRATPAGNLRRAPEARYWADLRDLQLVCWDCLDAVIAQRLERARHTRPEARAVASEGQRER